MEVEEKDGSREIYALYHEAGLAAEVEGLTAKEITHTVETDYYEAKYTRFGEDDVTAILRPEDKHTEVIKGTGRMVLRFAAKYCHWNYRPMDIHYPTPRVSPYLQVLTLGQQKKLLQYINLNFNYYNLGISICLQTGLRIGEICALTWADLDLKAGLLRVNKTLQRVYLGPNSSEIVLDSPKTAHSYREVPLSAQLIAQLRPLKRRADPRHFVLTGAAKAAEPAVFRAYFKRLMRSLGLPLIRFHGLRHSFATRCIECGCDYKTVSALLGHANISTTLNLYVHPNIDHKKRCVNKASRRLQ